MGSYSCILWPLNFTRANPQFASNNHEICQRWPLDHLFEIFILTTHFWISRHTYPCFSAILWQKPWSVVFTGSGEAIFLVLELPLGPGQNADCRKEDMTIPRTLAFDPKIYPNGSLAEFPQWFLAQKNWQPWVLLKCLYCSFFATCEHHWSIYKSSLDSQSSQTFLWPWKGSQAKYMKFWIWNNWIKWDNVCDNSLWLLTTTLMLIIGIYRLMIFSTKETGICLNVSEILTILGLLPRPQSMYKTTYTILCGWFKECSRVSSSPYKFSPVIYFLCNIELHCNGTIEYLELLLFSPKSCPTIWNSTDCSTQTFLTFRIFRENNSV